MTHELWYAHPADTDWTRALPLGSGRLGAMVFGNVTEERIALNEDSLWSGGPRDRVNPDARAALPEIRRLLFAGRLAEAHALTCDALSGIPDSQRHYEPLGDLLLTFPSGEVTDYRRSLDLDDAIAHVGYTQDGARYTREILTSAPDEAVAMRVTADRPGAVAFRVRLQRGPLDSYSSRFADTVRPVDGCGLLMVGAAGGEHGVRFAACLRVTVDGGTVRTLGDTVIVEGADAATLLLTAATTYREADPAIAARSRAIAAAERGWEAIRAAHLQENRAYFDRVSLTLGGDPALDALSTDARLARVQGGAADSGLDALYFHYGRYLLIAGSRPGSLASSTAR